MVDRWKLHVTPKVVLAEDGDLVAYDDYAALEAEVEAAYKRGHQNGRRSASDLISKDHRKLSGWVASLMRGGCWCEVGIGNPNSHGRHSKVCDEIRAFFRATPSESDPRLEQPPAPSSGDADRPASG